MDSRLTEISDSDEGNDIHLPLYFYGFTAKLKKLAKEELSEDDNTMQSALAEFRALLANERSNIFPTSDTDLIPFLRYRKYDVRRAHIAYKNYFAQFSKYDQLYKDLDFESVLKILRSNAMGFLSKRDVDGSFISIVLTKNWNPLEVNATNLCRAGTITYMDLMRCPITQITGVKLITDCSHLSIKSILTLRPWHVKFAAEYIQNSAPIRFKECHILNHGPVFHLLWKLMKPVLSEKFQKRVFFHGNDMQRLRAYFPPSILPEELGGDMGPFDNTEYMENFLKSENLLTENIRKFRTTKD